jgi:hypothetical protein
LLKQQAMVRLRQNIPNSVMELQSTLRYFDRLLGLRALLLQVGQRDRLLERNYVVPVKLAKIF